MNRLRYELQLLGMKTFLPPIVVAIGYTLVAILLHYMKTDPSRFLESGPEITLPMIIGMFTGATATYDASLELQLTMPRKYHWTGLLRIFLIIVWAAGISFLFINIMAALKLEYMFQPPHPEPAPLQFLLRELVWLAPMLWCIGIAVCLGLLIKSRTAGAALLGGIWVAEIVFKDYLVSTTWLRPVLLFPTTLVLPPARIPQMWFDIWLNTRFEIIATGLGFLLLGWLFLHSPEGLLKGMTEE